MTQFTRVVNGSTELTASLFNDLQEAIEQQSFNVMRYGAVGDGSTDDTAAIQAAIDATDAVGGAVFLPVGDYKITDGLTADGSFSLVGPGRILYPNTDIALRVNPTWGTAYAIDNLDNEIFPASTGRNCAKLGLDEYGQFTRGDIVLVYSTDDLAVDTTADRGELRMVAGTATGYVYLVGMLDDTYTTNPKIRKHPMCRVVIDGPTFTADGDPTTSEATRARCAVELIGCADSLVRCRFQDTWSRGLFLISCYGCAVDVVARNCRDDITNFAYGYGVSVGAASRYCTVKVNATNCRHAVTSNVWPSSGGDGYFGGPRNILVHDSYAHACASTGFDTHFGAWDWVFDNCHVDSQNVGDATSAGQYDAFVVRGADVTVQNCTHTGLGSFVSVYVGQQNYGHEAVTRIVNCLARTTDAQYSEEADRHLLRTNGTDYDHRIELHGCQSYNRDIYSGTGDATIVFDGCTLRNADLMRMPAGTTWIIQNTLRTGEDITIEPILVRGGCTLHLDGYMATGAHSDSSMIRGMDGADATWTVFAGNLSSPGGLDFRSDDGSGGTWDVTDTAVTVA